MVMSPMAARLYDKQKMDVSEFRNWVSEYAGKNSLNGFDWSGSTIDYFFQGARNRLQERVAEYFEWIEREAKQVEPSSKRREAIEQCVGATITLSRSIQSCANSFNSRMLKLDSEVDHGNWIDLDDEAIQLRGQRLLEGLGLNSRANITVRLNHIVKDHPWFFSLLSVLSFVLAVLALSWNIWNAYHGP
jgi:hypothetical protein